MYPPNDNSCSNGNSESRNLPILAPILVTPHGAQSWNRFTMEYIHWSSWLEYDYWWIHLHGRDLLHLVNPHSVLAPSKRYRPIDRCLVELVNPQEKQGNKICRRIMLFLSNINSECSIPGSVSLPLQPKQPLATWKCFTNRHPMICEAGTDISKT